MIGLPEFLHVNPVTNALRRVRSRMQHRSTHTASSERYWNSTHVDAPSAAFGSVEESLSHYRWRNDMYPGCMMPTCGADGLSVLDYGCGLRNDVVGFGHFSKPAALHAADVSTNSPNLAESRARLHGIPVTFHHIQESTSRVDLPDEPIDLIHCAGVLHYLPDPAKALQEWRRLLKRTGRAQVMVYHKDSVWLHLHVAYDRLFQRVVGRRHVAPRTAGDAPAVGRRRTTELSLSAHIERSRLAISERPCCRSQCLL